MYCSKYRVVVANTLVGYKFDSRERDGERSDSGLEFWGDTDGAERM
jgi:hypothetical protein